MRVVWGGWVSQQCFRVDLPEKKPRMLAGGIRIKLIYIIRYWRPSPPYSLDVDISLKWWHHQVAWCVYL